jgi:hypothetical protein
MSNSLLSRILSPAVLLYTYLSVIQVGQGLYLASSDQPPGFAVAQALGFIWVLGWWLARDSRRPGIGLFYCTGLFLYLAWPIIMPYYLLKTRGAKGLLVVAGFIGVYVAALVVGVFLYGFLAADTV